MCRAPLAQTIKMQKPHEAKKPIFPISINSTFFTQKVGFLTLKLKKEVSLRRDGCERKLIKNKAKILPLDEGDTFFKHTYNYTHIQT